MTSKLDFEPAFDVNIDLTYVRHYDCEARNNEW